MTDVADILREFTKDEIIAWLEEQRSRYWGTVKDPVRSDLLFIRWRLQSDRVRADYRAELQRWEAEKPDFAERDRLARQFNDSRDFDERTRLIVQMEPYNAAMRDHIDRCKALDRREKKVNAIYRQYEAAFAEETAQ